MSHSQAPRLRTQAAARCSVRFRSGWWELTLSQALREPTDCSFRWPPLPSHTPDGPYVAEVLRGPSAALEHPVCKLWALPPHTGWALQRSPHLFLLRKGWLSCAARAQHLETCMWSSLLVVSGRISLVPVSPSWSQAGASSVLLFEVINFTFRGRDRGERERI